MSNVWGNSIKLSIFGESHGVGIGVTIGHLPPGIKIDEEFIVREMNRRRPGQSKITTPRNEKDQYEILSGVFEGYTTGAPLSIVIRNTNTRSKDYSITKDYMRPGHADLTAHYKYDGYTDYRGGGHFSGRLTAGIVFAGALVKSCLKDLGIVVGSQIKSIGNVQDDYFNILKASEEDLIGLSEKRLPMVSDEKIDEVFDYVEKLKDDHESVGGVIRCFGMNVPKGLGNPFFNSFESHLSSFLYSIPAVKSVGFGAADNFANMVGSESNDEFYMVDGNIKSYTNNNGGINGGITNGMPIEVSVTMKATPSISKEQKTINIKEMEDSVFAIEGRHDPCILPRAAVVLESVLALTIFDLMMSEDRNIKRWANGQS